MTSTLKIALRDARFHAFHGVLEQEREVGNEFSLDLEVSLPLSGSLPVSSHVSDNIDSTISYASLYERVKEEMLRPHDLLEHLAAVIVDRIADEWPQIAGIDIRICKLAPPIAGSDCSACVSINWKRSELFPLRPEART